MKALIATAVAVAFCGAAFAADPVSKRAPNGGNHLYSNYHDGKGTVENGCILRWEKAGQHTIGYNAKRVDMGEATTFTDCKIEQPKIVPVVVVVPKPAPAPAPAPVVEAPKPAPAPVVEAPKPAPAPVAPGKKLRQ